MSTTEWVFLVVGITAYVGWMFVVWATVGGRR